MGSSSTAQGKCLHSLVQPAGSCMSTRQLCRQNQHVAGKANILHVELACTARSEAVLDSYV